MDLEQALGQFDRTQTNLGRLESVWERMQQLIPAGIVFPGGQDTLLYEDLALSFAELAAGLPSIDGMALDAQPLTLLEIAQGRLDVQDLGEPTPMVRLEEDIYAPTAAIADYRHRLSGARKKLVRERVDDLVVDVDTALAQLGPRYESDGHSVAEDPDWQRLVSSIKEIERLLGQDLVREGRWGPLARHIGFAQGADLHDIIRSDWPSVRKDIEAAQYGELEPLPVDVDDLGSLVASRPTGTVTTKLRWEALDDDGFERLVFNLLSNATGYENPRWLMKTRAPDRGRDLSVDRVISDELSGVRWERVIVQCKHWRSRSLNVDDCISAVGHVKLLEPPRVDALIIATSGRFTGDAVHWIDQHNAERDPPQVEMWAESHLELLLASRPALVTGLGLRG
jgi:hypothetical protein